MPSFKNPLAGLTALFMAASFNLNPVAADTDILPRTSDESVRPFDSLCVQGDTRNGDGVYARFLPNRIDYYTKLSPSARITEGEHVRKQLILSFKDVDGFINMVERSYTGDKHLRAQQEEMKQAREAFFKHRLKFSQGIAPDLPPCDSPFPKPK